MNYNNIDINKEAKITPETYRGYIENYIGVTQVPTGVVGPLLIDSSEGKKNVYVPMATTEGALVISYNRGIKLVSSCGGVTSRCIASAVQRAPGFKVENLTHAIGFENWILQQLPVFRKIIKEISSHAVLSTVECIISGRLVTVEFTYDTKDAAGQNMSTVCTQKICDFIIENSPFPVLDWFIESNFSSDKKASIKSLVKTRGKRVVAESIVTREALATQMKATPEQLLTYWSTVVVNTAQLGSIGLGGHFANGIAAIFLACGQDVACIGEASIGLEYGEINNNGDLYVSVVMPNLIVGTVGGGTNLSSQKECLKLMDCYGDGRSIEFAEICAATILAGEISIASSIATGTFTRAHMIYGRRKKIAQ